MEKMSGEENDLEQHDCTTMSLPDEILSSIFAMLRLEDRKSVRLVCRSWYHCSTYWSITKNEKFVFRVDSSIEEIVGVMLKSNLSISNLEFQGLPIVRLPENFWKVCGHRIHSLEFFECVGNDETIKNIIIYCENLMSLIFRKGDRDDRLGREIARLPEFLDELVEKGIQRTKLRHFEILTHYSLLSGVDLSKIFLVYPCMTHFTAYRGNFCDSFSGFPNSLESLTFLDEFFSIDGMEVCNAIVKQLAGLNGLRRFEGSLDIRYLPIETLFNFFSSQENLNVVNLELNCLPGDRSNHPVLSKIIFHVLESCLNLRELFIVEDQVYFTWEEFIRFLAVISKLQCLRMDINLFENPSTSLYDEASKSLQFSKNFALTTLELEIAYEQEHQDHIYSVLLPHCPLLLHLKLRVHSDYLLQIIFQYLLKLQTLILTILYIEGDIDYAFTGRYDASEGEGYSIKRLQQLKHLDIVGLRCMRGRIGSILLEFQFPLLEFLLFDIELERVPEEVLNRFPLQVPELRDLIFLDHSRTACTDKIIQFCGNFKKLHYLCICAENKVLYDLRNRVSERIEEIFCRCPNLRYFSDLNSVLFSFDPITKKVRETKLMNTFKYRRSIFEEHSFAYL